MCNLTLFRKRLIPFEIVLLDQDEQLFHSDELLITRWRALHPKKTLSHGISCYYLNEGFKVSQFFNHEDQLMYWYCDIIDTVRDEAAHTYTFIDLLADVIVTPSGDTHILDLDELADAVDRQLITPAQLSLALRRLHRLLQIIENGQFGRLLAPMKPYRMF